MSVLLDCDESMKNIYFVLSAEGKLGRLRPAGHMTLSKRGTRKEGGRTGGHGEGRSHSQIKFSSLYLKCKMTFSLIYRDMHRY